MPFQNISVYTTLRLSFINIYLFQNYIARFGHGSAKLARQAQSKEKTLAKMVAGGLTEKVSKDRSLTFSFPDCGKIPPPVRINVVGLCYIR